MDVKILGQFVVVIVLLKHAAMSLSVKVAVRLVCTTHVRQQNWTLFHLSITLADTV